MSNNNNKTEEHKNKYVSYVPMSNNNNHKTEEHKDKYVSYVPMSKIKEYVPMFLCLKILI